MYFAVLSVLPLVGNVFLSRSIIILERIFQHFHIGKRIWQEVWPAILPVFLFLKMPFTMIGIIQLLSYSLFLWLLAFVLCRFLASLLKMMCFPGFYFVSRFFYLNEFLLSKSRIKKEVQTF